MYSCRSPVSRKHLYKRFFEAIILICKCVFVWYRLHCRCICVTLLAVFVDAPSAPGGPLEASDVKADAITLTWRPPADTGGAPVERYVLEKKPKGLCQVFLLKLLTYPVYVVIVCDVIVRVTSLQALSGGRRCRG